LKEKNIRIAISMRSSEPEVLEKIKENMATTAQKYGADYEFSANYPEWRYRPVSTLRDKAVEVWKELTG